MSEVRFKCEKENIVLKIADIQMVKNLDEGMITSKIMDLTIVYYYILMHYKNFAVTIPLTIEILEKLNMNNDDLYKLALENTLRLNPPEIMLFEDAIKHFNLFFVQEKCEERKDASKDVYLVTNNYGTGAVGILDRNTLDFLAGKVDDDLAIIPSSSHEILVLAKNHKRLREWVWSVKETHEKTLEMDERLSNNIYFYNKATKEFNYQSADDFIV